MILSGIALVFYWSIELLTSNDPAHPYFQNFSLDTISRSYIWYWSKILFAPDAPEVLLTLHGRAATLLTILLFLILTALSWRYRHLREGWLFMFGWLLFWILLFPTAIMENHYSYDYYIYTPLLGLIVGMSAVVAFFWKRPQKMRQPWLVLLFLLLFGHQIYQFLEVRERDFWMNWTQHISSESRLMSASIQDHFPDPPTDAHLTLQRDFTFPTELSVSYDATNKQPRGDVGNN